MLTTITVVTTVTIHWYDIIDYIPCALLSSQWLIYFIVGILYFVLPFTYYTHSPPPPLNIIHFELTFKSPFSPDSWPFSIYLPALPSAFCCCFLWLRTVLDSIDGLLQSSNWSTKKKKKSLQNFSFVNIVICNKIALAQYYAKWWLLYCEDRKNKQ